MFVDLFYELGMPPQLSRSEADLYAESLAEMELADRLGFHGVWLVEHHLMPGYSHLSKPELLLAALARRTQRLRLGLSVIPLPLHHPLHVAERIATLDVLSGGRIQIEFPWPRARELRHALDDWMNYHGINYTVVM